MNDEKLYNEIHRSNTLKIWCIILLVVLCIAVIAGSIIITRRLDTVMNEFTAFTTQYSAVFEKMNILADNLNEETIKGIVAGLEKVNTITESIDPETIEKIAKGVEGLTETVGKIQSVLKFFGKG